MNIIERAADMLGLAVPNPHQKPSIAAREAETLEPGAVERAVTNDSSPADFSAQKRTPKSAAKDTLVLATGSVSRTLNVDLNTLRQQNIITPDEERTPVSENFRRIKRHILANVANPDAGQGINLVMITSALPGEGKTFCAINLALSIAMEMDRTVLLVDADVAKPSINSALGIRAEAGKGLMDVLLNRGIDLASVLYKTDIEKLSVLPAGARHARTTEVLASERMRVILQEMAERYPDRVIIFDSPPLLVASEACALASHMGQILVVVEAGKTTEAAVKEALGRIESRKVLGMLLNKGGAPEAAYGYFGYGYGYGYGHSA